MVYIKKQPQTFLQQKPCFICRKLQWKTQLNVLSRKSRQRADERADNAVLFADTDCIWIAKHETAKTFL